MRRRLPARGGGAASDPRARLLQPGTANDSYWSMTRRFRLVAMALGLVTVVLLPFMANSVAAQATSVLSAIPAGSGAPAVLALPGGVVWDYDGYQILRSTDAGAKWKVVLPTWELTPVSLQVTGAFFLNAKDAWAETEHQWPAQPGATTTWETTNGGATWHQGTSLPGAPSYGTPGFDEFAFADAEHGLGFGVGAGSAPSGSNSLLWKRRDYLWATSDGGMHWRRQPAVGLPWQASTYSAGAAGGCPRADPFNLTMESASASVLWDAGCPTRQPGLWQSTDGGRQWYALRLPAPPGGWPAAEAWRYPARGVAGAEVLAFRYFANGDSVIAMTTRPGELVVYTSIGGGGTWSLASVLQTGSLARPSGFWASSPDEWEMPAPAGLYVTADAGRHWRLQRSASSLPAWTEVSFASPATGVAFGTFPELGFASSGAAGMRTSDGGQSWETVQFSTPSFVGYPSSEIPFDTVDFANARDGWVGGADGVEATTDGGTNWASQLSTPEPVEELSFADAEHGWALTTDELFSTSDGGRRWSVKPQTDLGAFSHVQLVSPSFGVGVICGQPGGTRVLATDDQGLTWHLLHVPDHNGLECGSVPPSPGAISGVCFGTARAGWAVGHQGAGSPAVVERTGDGGLHWSVVATFNTPPGALACAGSSDAWFGFTYGADGTGGAVAGTVDAGRTWRVSVKPAPHGPLFVPEVMPADRTPVGTLGARQSPAGVLEEPVATLAAPGAGAIVDLWRNYGPACANGFGIALSTDGGTTWSGTPGRSPYAPPCGTVALPFLSATAFLLPSLSFPSEDVGFVLGPIAGTATVPKGVAQQVTMALIATSDSGRNWHLLARFPWRPLHLLARDLPRSTPR